jgi:hypothetical protein
LCLLPGLSAVAYGPRVMSRCFAALIFISCLVSTTRAGAAEPLVQQPPPSSDAHPPTNGWAVRFGMGSTLGVGVAPRVAVGGTADLGVHWPVTWPPLPIDGVSGSLGVRADPLASGYVHGFLKEAQIIATRYFIFLSPCVHRWKFFACGVFGGGQFYNLSGVLAHRAGRQSSEGGPLAVQESDFAPPIFVAGGRFGVEVPFAPHLGFRVSGELLGNLTPVTLPIDDRSGNGWTTPLVSGGFEVGLYVFSDLLPGPSD